jgi:hypothetical protein
MYHKLDRIEYLSQIGNIVMHIQLNKGQMTELRDATEKQRNVQNEDSDDASENSVLSSDEGEADEDSNHRGVGDELISYDSDRFNSTGANATLSSEEEDHPYKDRRIGKAFGGKKVVEHEVPEYKGKKCLVCKGRFNVKSKYQICKLCDKLVHVNNNKKCLKMKKYVKDENFVCILCNEVTEEPRSSVHEETECSEHDDDRKHCDNEETKSSGDRTEQSDESDIGSDQSNPNSTYIVEKPINYLDFTFDGFPCEGLVVEALDGSKEGVGETGNESVEITTDSNQDDDSDTFEENVHCHVCDKTFLKQEFCYSILIQCTLSLVPFVRIYFTHQLTKETTL